MGWKNPMVESGVLAASVHRFPIRVYYEDTDAAGIVYYANHLKFAERARTEMLRCLDLDHGTLRDRFGLTFAVRRCLADYRAPARLDDELDVLTRMTRLGGASIDLDQRIFLDRRLLVALELRLVLLGQELRVARLPAELRAALLPLRADGGS